MTPVLRPTRSADIPALQGIERDAQELFRDTGLIDIDATALVGITDHLSAIEEGLSFVAEVDGRVAGFAMGHSKPCGGVYLHELDVRSAFQKRGIGAALVERFASAARAKGAGAMFLSTFRDPPWNAPFYRRLGFRDMTRGEYAPWMAALEDEQATFLDIRTRVFMRLDV